MKIGLITDVLDDDSVGIGVYAKNIVQNLLDIDNKNEYVLIHFKHTEYYANKKEFVIPIPPIPFGKYLRKLFILPLFLAKEKFDIVHELSHIGPFLFSVGKYKKIITIFDLSPLDKPEYHPKIRYWQHLIALPLILKRIDHVFTISNFSKKRILAYFPFLKNKITITPCGVNETFREYTKNEKKIARKELSLPKKFFLFVGSLEPRKNLHKTLLAFEKFQKYHPDYQMVIVGKWGWENNNLLEYLNHLIQKGLLVWRKNAPSEDLPKYYNCAIALIYVSAYEGFGLPAAEAIVCGCKLITSKSSALGEIFRGKNILHVNEQSVNDIYQKMCQIVNLKRTNNYYLKQEFQHNWKESARNIIRVYQNL